MVTSYVTFWIQHQNFATKNNYENNEIDMSMMF